MSDNLEVWKRRYEREKNARLQAEILLEEKASQLYEANQKLEERVQVESSKSLRESKKFTELFRSSIDGILLHSMEGEILDCNQAIQQLFGAEKEDLLKHSTKMLFHESSNAILEEAKATLKDQGYIRFETQMQTLKGNKFPAEISCTLFEVDNETIVQAIIRDTTLAKKQRTELKQAIEMAVKASEAKSLFLATMSHEIRTPLNGILGFTDILLHEKVSDEQYSHLQIIKKSGDILLNIINDILDFSRIESNQIELEHADYNLIECIEETLDIQAQPAALKQVELLYFIEEDVPKFLNGDVGRLRQIILNLVSNGLKFTEQGSVSVKVSSPNTKTIQIMVSDTGIGFDNAIKEQLFSPFQQADASTTRKYGGTGLGLAICRQLIGVMGGSITADSTEGKGSDFVITLPLKKAIKPPRTNISHKFMKGLSVLVIDDHPTNLKFMKAKLSLWGCHIQLASHPHEAIKSIVESKDRYDILLVDMLMPDMDGIELANYLKNQCQDCPPMVLATSSRLEGESEKALKAGFHKVIHKPIREQELLGAIESALEKSIPQKRPEIHTARIAQNFALIVEDNAINAKLAKLVVERFGVLAHIAHNGQEAIDSLSTKPIYDIIFMDMQMPVMDGITATKKIRAGEAGENYKEIPIVAMTANAMPQDEALCISSGMNHFIAKPIQIDEIKNVLKSELAT